MSKFTKFNDVQFEVFRELVDRVHDDDGIPMGVILNYDGTSLRGNVTIEQVAGCSKEYQNALKVFTDIYCK